MYLLESRTQCDPEEGSLLIEAGASQPEGGCLECGLASRVYKFSKYTGPAEVKLFLDGSGVAL